MSERERRRGKGRGGGRVGVGGGVGRGCAQVEGIEILPNIAVTALGKAGDPNKCTADSQITARQERTRFEHVPHKNATRVPSCWLSA